MSLLGYNLALTSGLGPINGPLTKTLTAPLVLTGPGCQALSSTAGAAAVKVLSAHTSPRGVVRRCRLVALTAARNLSFQPVVGGEAAPTLTAVGDGLSINDGVLVIGAAAAGASYEFSIPDTHDLYVAASAAATAFQLFVAEVP